MLKLIKHVEKPRKRITEERQIQNKKRKKKKYIITLGISSLEFYQDSLQKKRAIFNYRDLNSMRIFDIKINQTHIKK